MTLRAILIRLMEDPLWEWSASFLGRGFKGESSESVSTPTPVDATTHCSCLSLLLPWFSYHNGLGFQTVGCNKPIFLWSCFFQSNSQPQKRSLHSKFPGHNIVTRSQLWSAPQNLSQHMFGLAHWVFIRYGKGYSIMKCGPSIKLSWKGHNTGFELSCMIWEIIQIKISSGSGIWRKCVIP